MHISPGEWNTLVVLFWASMILVYAVPWGIGVMGLDHLLFRNDAPWKTRRSAIAFVVGAVAGIGVGLGLLWLSWWVVGLGLGTVILGSIAQGIGMLALMDYARKKANRS